MQALKSTYLSHQSSTSGFDATGQTRHESETVSTAGSWPAPPFTMTPNKGRWSWPIWPRTPITAHMAGSKPRILPLPTHRVHGLDNIRRGSIILFVASARLPPSAARIAGAPPHPPMGGTAGIGFPKTDAPQLCAPRPAGGGRSAGRGLRYRNRPLTFSTCWQNLVFGDRVCLGWLTVLPWTKFWVRLLVRRGDNGFSDWGISGGSAEVCPCPVSDGGRGRRSDAGVEDDRVPVGAVRGAPGGAVRAVLLRAGCGGGGIFGRGAARAGSARPPRVRLTRVIRGVRAGRSGPP